MEKFENNDVIFDFNAELKEEIYDEWGINIKCTVINVGCPIN